MSKGSSCTTSAVPLNVTAEKTPSTLVLAGAAEFSPVPLVATSPDGGETWSYPTLPADVTAGY